MDVASFSGAKTPGRSAARMQRQIFFLATLVALVLAVLVACRGERTPAKPPEIGLPSVEPTLKDEGGWLVVAGDITVTVSAQGAEKVDFYLAPTGTGVTPSLVYTDEDGRDGWQYRWTVPDSLLAHLWVVATNRAGSTKSELIKLYNEPQAASDRPDPVTRGGAELRLAGATGPGKLAWLDEERLLFSTLQGDGSGLLQVFSVGRQEPDSLGVIATEGGEFDLAAAGNLVVFAGSAATEADAEADAEPDEVRLISFDLDSRQTRALDRAARDLHAVRISPDGRRLVLTDGAGLHRINLSSGEKDLLIATKGEEFEAQLPRHPAWDPYGAHIAFTYAYWEGSSEVHVADAKSGEVKRLTAGAGAANPAWSPDGTQILYVAAEYGDTEMELAVAAYPSGQTQTLARGEELAGLWVEPGRVLLAQGKNGDTEIRYRDLATGEDSLVLAVDGGVRAPALSPDGKGLAYFQINGDRVSLVVSPVTLPHPLRRGR